MKYGLFGTVIPLMLDKTMYPFVEKQSLDLNMKKYKKKVRSEYKAMVHRFPGVGPKNNLVMGLYLAAYMLAFYKAAPDKITEPVFEELVNALCYCPAMEKMSKGKNFFTKKNMEARAAHAKRSQTGEQPFDWKFTFSYDMDKPECYINYSECAICKMGIREGCSNLLPYLCITDYANQEQMGNTLIRTKTLANGDDRCDFHIIGGRCS